VQPLRSFDASLNPGKAPAYSRRRLLGIGGVAAASMVALTARLFYLQIVRGTEHRDQAENNRLRQMPVPAQRGLVYDRHRIAMLRNRPSFTISIMPADLPKRPEVVYRRLVKLIGGSANEIGRAVQRSKTDPFTKVPVRLTSDPRAAHAIEERHLELPGVSVEAEPIREYLDGPMTSHLLGHVGRVTEAQLTATGGPNAKYGPNERIGQSGLEATFDDDLRGTPGEKQAEVDATGREVGIVALEPPAPGRNVVLTIDLPFQREIHRILAERIKQFEVASVVTVDPWTGHVLSLNHLPAYDNGLFSESLSEDDFEKLIADPTRPLLNGALSSSWPPGSCFKVITALAALEHGIVSPELRIHCGGGIRAPRSGASRPCWTSHGHQDLIAALASSCDTYFYHLVGGEPNGRWPGLGAERLAEWAKLFGLGRPTGLPLPLEANGVVPNRAWKREHAKEAWYLGDDWISAIGQGFYTTTPIQMAMVAATLANGGTLMRPRLVSEVVDARGRIVRQIAPEAVRKLPASDANIQLVREGVRAGMLIGVSPWGSSYTGTSHTAKIPDIPIAGKTGTSEYGVEGSDGAAPGKLPTHGWFIFWAPHERPKLAGAVFVKRGRGAQEAGVVASQVVKAYFGIV
jgi:penicillin-binding protein 2